MNKKKRKLEEAVIPEFAESLANIAEDSRIFVDKSMEIAHYIFRLMEAKNMKQKDLAAMLGKSEAEVSKWLAGMHNFTLRSLAKLEAALGSNVITVPKEMPGARIVFTEMVSLASVKKSVPKQPDPNTAYGKVVLMNNPQCNELAKAN